MPQQDFNALIISYVYVGIIILLGEVLGRFVFHQSTAFTRKFVHVGVGMWVFATVRLFTAWEFAIIPPVTFVAINYLSYRRELFKGIESADKTNLGTVYFPISFAMIIAIFWPRPEIVVAGMMPMVWGDALAAVIGERWGKHPFAAFNTSKTREGSLTMFLASLVTVFLALLLYNVSPELALVSALIVAAAATVLELITPNGMDNLAVPLASAALLWLLL